MMHPPTPSSERQNFLLEVYWPPITFSTSIWLWWNAVLSPPTPKHDCTDDNTPPWSTHPPTPIPFMSCLLTRYDKPVKQTTFYIICTHTPQWKQQCWVQLNRMQGGRVGPCDLSPQERGGEKNNSKNKTHPSGQQDLHKCVCFRDCNGSLMRHEYSATYQNKKHLISECTRQPTVHQLAMLVRHLKKKRNYKFLHYENNHNESN